MSDIQQGLHGKNGQYWVILRDNTPAYPHSSGDTALHLMHAFIIIITAAIARLGSF